jgi:hypothetical protein
MATAAAVAAITKVFMAFLLICPASLGGPLKSKVGLRR